MIAARLSGPAMAVAGRRDQARVAQRRGDQVHRGSVIEGMAGVRVTEEMRAGLDPGTGGGGRDVSPGGRGIDRPIIPPWRWEDEPGPAGGLERGELGPDGGR
jgi:hypothetical protein